MFLTALAEWLGSGRTAEQFEKLFQIAKESDLWLTDQHVFHMPSPDQRNRNRFRVWLEKLDANAKASWSKVLHVAFEYDMRCAGELKKHSPFSGLYCVARINYVQHSDCHGTDTAMRGEYEKLEERLREGATVKLAHSASMSSNGTFLGFEVESA